MNHRPGASKRNQLNPPPIYDGPHVFRVRSGRSHSETRSDRDEDKSDGTHRGTLRCNWPDFLKKKIRFGKFSLQLLSRVERDMKTFFVQRFIHRTHSAISQPTNKDRRIDRRLSIMVDTIRVLNWERNVPTTLCRFT